MQEMLDLLTKLGITELPSTIAILAFCYYFIIKNIDERFDRIEDAIRSGAKELRSLRTPCDKPLSSLEAR